MSPKRNNGDRRGQIERYLCKRRELRESYRSGLYVIGSFSAEVCCAGCGNTFPKWRPGPMQFCSRLCAGKDLGAEEARRRRRLYDRQRKVRRDRRKPKIERTCSFCSQPFVSSISKQIYCSRRCGQRALQTVRRKHATQARACKGCGYPFEPAYGNKRRGFCSKKCMRRHHRIAFGKNHRQRARRYGVAYEPVNRIEVFERDQWTCQICGTKTPRRLMGTIDPSAPELDHRIPMAPPHNGPHSYVNCQCACRDCNGRKGATVVVGQQPLFARL